MTADTAPLVAQTATAEPRTHLLTVVAHHPRPVGQGAISLGRHGAARHTNDAELRPWRTAIRNEVTRLLGTHQFEKPKEPKLPPGIPKPPSRPKPCLVCGFMAVDHGYYRGPLAVDITITLPKLKSAPKRRVAWPTTRSSFDLDHHVRAVLDAVSMGSAWVDDAQIVDLTARKRYVGGEGPGVLTEPGAVIHLWQVGGAA